MHEDTIKKDGIIRPLEYKHNIYRIARQNFGKETLKIILNQDLIGILYKFSLTR